MKILPKKYKKIQFFIQKIYILFFVCTFLFFSNLSTMAFCKDNYTLKELYDAKKKAFALYNTGDNDGALAILEEIDKSDWDENILIVLANIYEDKGEINKSISILSQLSAINPKFYKAYYNSGCLLLKKKDYELAIENFKLCLKYNKDFAWANYNLGCVYFELGEYKKAKKYFIRAINQKNNEKNFYYNLALTYKKLNQEKHATKILETYNKLKENQ